MQNARYQQPTPRKRVQDVNDAAITRRQFVIGGAGVVAILAFGGIYFVTSNSNDEAGSGRLSVATSQVITINDLEKVDDVEDFLQVEREVKLSYNTLVMQSSNKLLAMMESTGEGTPVCTSSTMSFTDARTTEILSTATTDKPRFEVLDFRANENGFVWVESNVLTGENIVKTAIFNSDAATEGKVAMTSGSSHKMPLIEISGNTAWIQTAPQSTTEGEKEKLFRIKLGASENSLEQVTETRAFATSPTWTESGIVITPKNSYSTSCVDVSLLDGDTGDLLDNLTLPQSMTPQDVTYGKSGFSFTFQGSYDYGAGLANVGTYVQANLSKKLSGDDNVAKDERNADLSSQNWLSFNREPTCPCAWIGNYVAVKSTSSVAIIDIANKKYALIEADDGADDYGVWLVSSGVVDHLVTLQNIDYTSVSGNAIREGRLKIWKA